jgi:phosphohistidine phosphatase SixA
MKLFILRHGEALPLAAVQGAKTDADRPLTDNGFTATAQAAATLLERLPERAGLLAIYHSPFLRTTQTAGQLCSSLKQLLPEWSTNDSHYAPLALDCQPADALKGNSTVATTMAWLQNLDWPAAGMVLVSHQPLVASLCAWLVEGDRSSRAATRFPFAPSTLAVLELDAIGPGGATLVALEHHTPTRREC